MDPLKRALVWVAVSSLRQAADDKISLEYQEQRAREWCAAHGYEVVEVLEVKGHSRSDPNLIRLLELYERKGVKAYARLQELWASKGFDVLVAYSSDRLGRSGTLIHWVIETCYYEGMQICLTDGGGLMDPANYRMQALLGTAQSTMPMDALKDKTAAAKEDLVKLGLSSGRYPLSHVPLRDPVSGDVLRTIINEDARPLYNAIADLLIKRLPWSKIGAALAQQYGFRMEDGKLFDGGTLRRLILNDWTFGNSASGQSFNKEGNLRGRWLFDADAPRPTGVTIYYNVPLRPAIFDGERLEQLKAELRARFEIKGRGTSMDAHRFSRLCICDECGYLMSVLTKTRQKGRVRYGYVCSHAGAQIPEDRRCLNKGHAPRKVIQDFIDKQLKRYLSTAEAAPVGDEVIVVSEMETLIQSIARTKSQIRRAIEEQLQAEEASLQQWYRETLKGLNQRLEDLERQRREVQAQQAVQQRLQVNQEKTIDYIKTIGLEAFWKLPDPTINQWLHRFFGDLRIAIRDKEIVSLKRRTKKTRY